MLIGGPFRDRNQMPSGDSFIVLLNLFDELNWVYVGQISAQEAGLLFLWHANRTKSPFPKVV